MILKDHHLRTMETVFLLVILLDLFSGEQRDARSPRFIGFVLIYLSFRSWPEEFIDVSNRSLVDKSARLRRVKYGQMEQFRRHLVNNHYFLQVYNPCSSSGLPVTRYALPTAPTLTRQTGEPMLSHLNRTIYARFRCCKTYLLSDNFVYINML